MAKIIIETKVDWSNGHLITNPDGSTYWTGARYIQPELPEGDTVGFNMDGWVDLTKVEKGKLDVAEIYIRVSDKMVREIDASKDFKIKTLIDDAAKTLLKDLTNFSAIK